MAHPRDSGLGKAVAYAVTQEPSGRVWFQRGKAVPGHFMSSDTRALQEIQLLRAELCALVARLDLLESEILERVTGAESTVAESASVAKAKAAPKRRGTPVVSEGERVAAARATGRFFADCLAGRPRRPSGRSRVNIPNTCYVVVKDYQGEVYTDPVRLFHDYASVQAIVCRGGQAGQFGGSVFAGFAEAWEARIAVAEAGLGWPVNSEE